LAQAHACGGSNCKPRGIPTLATRAQRKWKGRSAAEVCTSAARKIGEWLAGASGQSPLGRASKGKALRTGHRSARGVAQDVPFFTAARLKRRAGALTETGRSYKNEDDFLVAIRPTKILECISDGPFLTAHYGQYFRPEKHPELSITLV